MAKKLKNNSLFIFQLALIFFLCTLNTVTAQDSLCEPGKYFNMGACYQCSIGCKTCDSNPYKCTSCNDGFYLNSLDDCAACSFGCKSCKSDGTCLQCFPAVDGKPSSDGCRVAMNLNLGLEVIFYLIFIVFAGGLILFYVLSWLLAKRRANKANSPSRPSADSTTKMKSTEASTIKTAPNSAAGAPPTTLSTNRPLLPPQQPSARPTSNSKPPIAKKK